MNELQDIYEAGYLDGVLSGVPLDAQIREAASPASSGWTNAISQRHHWQTLHALEEQYNGTLRNNVRQLIRYLQSCQGLYRLLEGNGVQFEPNTNGDHLTDWLRAVRDFAREVGLAP